VPCRCRNVQQVHTLLLIFVLASAVETAADTLPTIPNERTGRRRMLPGEILRDKMKGACGPFVRALRWRTNRVSEGVLGCKPLLHPAREVATIPWICASDRDLRCGYIDLVPGFSCPLRQNEARVIAETWCGAFPGHARHPAVKIFAALPTSLSITSVERIPPPVSRCHVLDRALSALLSSASPSRWRTEIFAPFGSPPPLRVFLPFPPRTGAESPTAAPFRRCDYDPRLMLPQMLTQEAKNVASDSISHGGGCAAYKRFIRTCRGFYSHD
jgi:hypothetical protein